MDYIRLVAWCGLALALPCFGQAPPSVQAPAPKQTACWVPGSPQPPGQNLPLCELPPGVHLPTWDCSYEGQVWANGSFRVTGRICQLCAGGTWAERSNRRPNIDPQCRVPSPPGGGSNLRIDARYDCDAGSSAPSSHQAIRYRAGKCETCVMAAWVEGNLFSCNVPQLELPTSESPLAASKLGYEIHHALGDEGFDELQAFIDSIVKGDKRTPDGVPMSALLGGGYEEFLGRAQGWDEQLASIRQWRTKSPQSGAAAFIEAHFWIAYAWLARGHEFAAKVPEKAFNTAHERMQNARAALEETKAYAAENPAWYDAMLVVAVFEGWPKAERFALFYEAVKAAPFYEPIYSRMAWGLTPKWGGSLDDYHHFVTAAVERTRSADGNQLYARLYWSLAANEREKDPFADLKIPWKRMKSGFDDLMARYPDSAWNLQHYAYFACRAGDGKTFNTLLPKLATKLPSGMSSPWHDLYTRDYCETRFSKPKGDAKH